MMIKRTIEISSAARLTIKHKQLIIHKKKDTEHLIPFEDIGFLILNHPQILCTQAVFRACAIHDTTLVVTDDKHMPAALLQGFAPHSLQGKITKMQAEVPNDRKQQLWQTIVKCKIEAQATAIKATTGAEHIRLGYLARTVQPGDRLNHEAQAAQIYFPALFGRSFRRNHEAEGKNALLNYGYSILRSACARALMGAGLNPVFGLQHSNQYNAFCLADDIMEPLRPMVDLVVYHMSAPYEINQETKVPLLTLLDQTVLTGTKKQSLVPSLSTYCASLRKILQTGKGKLLVPRLYE